jgi:membrane-bound metal-dependent hydrolase YbcI (DUF457 family)
VRGGTHIVIGAASAGLGLWAAHGAGVAVSPGVSAAVVAVAVAGAIAPDIDHRDSTISSRVPGTLMGQGVRLLAIPAALALAIAYFGAASLGAGVLESLDPLVRWGLILVVPAIVLRVSSSLIALAFGHRGATHSLLFAAGAALLVAAVCMRFAVPPWYGLVFGGGWLTHLLADSLSRRGLPSLLWPFVGR